MATAPLLQNDQLAGQSPRPGGAESAVAQAEAQSPPQSTQYTRPSSPPGSWGFQGLRSKDSGDASADADKVVLGVLHEGYNPAKQRGDQRVSIVPDVAQTLVKEGYVVLVETGAGTESSFTDESYLKAGCKVASRADVMRKGQIMFCINPPVRDLSSLKNKVIISWVGRLTDDGKNIVKEANAQKVTLIDVTAIPRITIAQKLDVLSSQAKVAGHRAVVEATYRFGRFHTTEMTAAGKYPPSQTFVLGCGVAGLAAIGTAKSLGSVVRAWDVRDVSDQVYSMGAKWVKVDFEESGEGTGGYAKESSEAFKVAQQKTFAKVLKDVDIVITTAAIPGRRAPLLITESGVAGMKSGSVIVDLAASGGGNCELTKPGECYTTKNGVTIMGYSDLPSRMAEQSSSMYAQNMVNLVKHLQGNEGSAGLMANMQKNLDDEEGGDIVARSIICCHKGSLVKMPKPQQPTPTDKPKTMPVKKATAAPSPLRNAILSAAVLCIGIACCLGLGEGIKPASLLTTFLLAGTAGYQAVWGVAHALHTPLMSVTNAISGMTAVGGLLLFMKVTDPLPKKLAMMAVAVSSINIFGGFMVSQRMLNLFKKKDQKEYSYLMLSGGVVLILAVLLRPELLVTVNSVSAALCVAAIGGLAAQSTANAGCKFGMLGVFGSVAATLKSLDSKYVFSLATAEYTQDLLKYNATKRSYEILAHNTVAYGYEMWIVGVVLLAIGGVIGLCIGRMVSPIALPQTVAAFHSFVGLAAMLTSIASFSENPVGAVNVATLAAIFGDFIGGVTLTGSIIAFLKLDGRMMSSKPLNLPCKNYLNLASLLLFLFFVYIFVTCGDGSVYKCGVNGFHLLWATAVLSCLMGLHLVGSVGGGDMPVCITVLNSYSGWALVTEGFLLRSYVLTVVGSLIGFSGAILTKIMCDAMNRDIFNVLFGGINTTGPAKKGGEVKQVHQETTISAVADALVGAKEVLAVPGYGMAMSRAQTAMGELAATLREHNILFEFGVHPVAGRMPGQMNVLLAEAGVPHEWVFEMEEVNAKMDKYDVVLVIGANDVVNSAAQEIEGCAIWGMPVIEVWRAKKVIFCKRSMAGGYADLDNPVFYKSNTDMLLGDGKKTADGLAAAVREPLNTKA